MWFIFPQVKGLGSTEMSIKYSIDNLDEAVDYLNHPVLGQRLKEITGELLKVEDRSALEIFGSPDNKKLKSCMTLFSIISQKDNLFEKVLEHYFMGEEDKRTRELMNT